MSGAGCSLLYDLSAEQCTTSGDCTAIFGSGYECNAAQICEPPATGIAGSPNGGSDPGGGGSSGGGAGGDGGSSGVSNGGAGDTGGSSAGVGGSAQVECTTNAQCMELHGDAPWACRNNSCVELVSDSCPFVIGLENLRTSENPIIFGAFTYIPPTAQRDSPVTANYELAINEFTAGATGGGLNSANGRRKMVAVACDGINPSTFEASVAHLTDTVGVAAVLSPFSSADLVTLFEGPASSDANIFFMSPLDADSSLTTLQDDGRVWNILGSGANLAPAYVPLLARAEALVKGQQTISTIRVALIRDDTEFMGDMSGVLTSSANAITFNGLSITANGLDYQGFTIPSDPTALGAAQTYNDTVTALIAFQPHVIISLTAGAFINGVMAPLEDNWDTGEQARPFYLVSPYHAGFPDLSSLVGLLNGLPAGERLNLRMLGVNFESADDLTLAEAYHVRFSSAYAGSSYPVNFENFYDAAWYLMYAYAAAGEVGSYSGEDVRRGMSRIVRLDAPEAFHYAVGGVAETNSDVAEVLSAIATRDDNGIQLIGTMGPPDFDPGTGARKTQGSAYCVNAGGAFFFDVLRYNPTGPAIEGDPTGTCVPPGFMDP